MRIIRYVIILVLVLFLFYVAGPRVHKPSLAIVYPELTENLRELEASIQRNENAVEGLKQDNESRIIWFDTIYQRTAYSIVYLPGFSASYAEGMPVHRRLAQRYGCNLYLPRLRGHGVYSEEALLDYHGDSLLQDAVHALAIGNRIGDKVILMGTSTGATFALWLASNFPDQVAGLILYSPNIALANPLGFLLSEPWGLQLLRKLNGGPFREYDASDEYKRYWITRYRLEAVPALQALLDATMHSETFQKVSQPVFMGYYYKSEAEQDQVVSVPAMQQMFDQLGTSADKKRSRAFETAGNHVIGSYLTSGAVEEVAVETFRFAKEVLKLSPVGKK